MANINGIHLHSEYGYNRTGRCYMMIDDIYLLEKAKEIEWEPIIDSFNNIHYPVPTEIYGTWFDKNPDGTSSRPLLAKLQELQWPTRYQWVNLR